VIKKDFCPIGNQISVFTDVIIVRIFMLVVLRVKRNSSMFMEEFRFFGHSILGFGRVIIFAAALDETFNSAIFSVRRSVDSGLTGKQIRSSICRFQRLQRKNYWPEHRAPLLKNE